MLDFLLLSLAVWRVTALLVYDSGPRDVFVRLRDVLGGPLSCFWCTSVWVSLVASFVYAPKKLLSWWAVAGASVLIDEIRMGKPEHD